MTTLSIDELKDLIIFCKEHKVKSAKFGEISFEISEGSLYLEEGTALTPFKEEKDGSKVLVDTNITEQDMEDEELLFLSAT